MVALTLKHDIHWQAPIPLWAENSTTGLRVTNESLAPQPSILRFATDSFMQDFLEMVADNPQRLSECLVQAETWREPMKNPSRVSRKKDTNSLGFLLNHTKQISDQIKNPDLPKKHRPRQAVVVSDETVSLNTPIKLFQSTHQRFYLVSASLLSAEPGYPDQKLNLSQKEKATFVVRRLLPKEGTTLPSDGESINNLADWLEYAYVETDKGPRWKLIDQLSSHANRTLFSGEEQLPLFPVNYKDSCVHDRVLMNGLIPVSKREKWMSAPIGDALMGNDDIETPETSTGFSRARIMFQTDVAEPWKILMEQGEFKKQNMARSFDNLESSGNSTNETNRARRTQRDIIQTASWYVLLDFARFLKKELPAVWNVAQSLVKDDTALQRDFDLETDQHELLERIQQARLSNSLIDALLQVKDQYVPVDDLDIVDRRNAAILNKTVYTDLLQAIVAVDAWSAELEAVDSEFVRFDDSRSTPVEMSIDSRWPEFLFPLADPQFNGPVPANINSSGDLEHRMALVDQLADLIEKILPEAPEFETIAPPASNMSQRDGWFIIRCVYERPHCGPLFPALVSNPTRVFQMAPFFDPDAPTRPVRIPMPVDISPAGLRKFQKNTAFVMSDMLCGKIKKIRKMSLGDLVLSVLPWPFHKDLPDPNAGGPCKSGESSFGMICSLSIPIVTLCALILLMIMVALFDLFFRWLPFLFLCLPIPGFKGKRDGN